MYFKKMIGEKVYLSPRSVDDASKYVAWLNNYDIAKFLRQYTNNINLENEKDYLLKEEPNSYHFAIVDKETDELIGSIGLMNVDNISRTAELGIFIGDEDHLSRGYGSDAIKLLLNFGFNHANLNNIMLNALSFNKRALKAYEKCGFKLFGTWPKACYGEGEYHDLVFMYILKDDFNKK